MKVRYTITVAGDVQGAGYRAAVRGIAKKMKIAGYVENLEDSDVRIVAEGDKSNLERFKKAVAIRGEHVNVEGMRTRKGKPTGEFKGFKVKVADLASEMFQGYATAEKYFSSLGSDIRTVGQKVDTVGQKVDVVGQKVDPVGQKVDVVGQKVDTLTEHTDSSFASLDEKYHSISEILKTMNENSQTMQREFIQSMNENSQTMQREFNRTREELSRVVDSLVALVRERKGGNETGDVA